MLADLAVPSPFPSTGIVREATYSDQSGIDRLINGEYYVHRHLDWRSPLEWLGSQPFLINEVNDQIVGVLSMPADPPGVYWLRLFSAAGKFDRASVFRTLFSKARETIGEVANVAIVALSFQSWFAVLLEENGFTSFQDIVVLEWSRDIREVPLAPAGLSLCKMGTENIDDVLTLDNQAFEPIWRLSRAALEMALHQASYATVCRSDDKVIGYQLSTASPTSTHLARLAVSPDYQRRQIAKYLLFDLQQHISHSHPGRLTVNTQSTNAASLSLYDSMGFLPTMESFPVYRLEQTV